MLHGRPTPRVIAGACAALILCAHEYSPAGHIGMSIGVVMCIGWLGHAIGAWQGGLFYDLCSDNFPSLANASPGGLVNLLLLGFLYLNAVHRPRLAAGAQP